MKSVCLLFSLLLLVACSGGAVDSDACAGSACFPDLGAVDAGTDLGPPVDAGPPWPHELTPTSMFPVHRGLLDARAIIHLHSPISHDACDGDHWVGGPLDMAQTACLSHLRAAVCATHLDFANLSDHASYVSALPYDQLFWKQTGDTEIHDPGTGELIGMQWLCPDGSPGPVVTVGSENSLMPMGMHHHVLATTDMAMLDAAYTDNTAAGVAVFHAAGALVFQNHAEQTDIDALRTLGLDGMELYNIHANVDPHIRPMWLGLDAAGYLPTALMFTRVSNHLEPDLVFMSFFSENGPDLSKWNTLLSEGRHMTGMDGCDAHENSFPQILGDGERLDSYRRMIRWATNHELVTARTVAGQVDALTNMRNYVAFEAFGTPVGFDYYADTSGTTAEMGETVHDGATLHVVAPHLPAEYLQIEAPAVTLHLYRADASGTPVEVATSSTATLDFAPTTAGAYYVVVRMVPNHTRPYLGTLADTLITDVPWIYANPIFVTVL